MNINTAVIRESLDYILNSKFVQLITIPNQNKQLVPIRLNINEKATSNSSKFLLLDELNPNDDSYIESCELINQLVGGLVSGDKRKLSQNGIVK